MTNMKTIIANITRQKGAVGISGKAFKTVATALAVHPSNKKDEIGRGD